MRVKNHKQMSSLQLLKEKKRLRDTQGRDFHNKDTGSLGIFEEQPTSRK